MFWVKGTLDRNPPVNELICIKAFYLLGRSSLPRALLGGGGGVGGGGSCKKIDKESSFLKRSASGCYSASKNSSKDLILSSDNQTRSVSIEYASQ